MLKPGNSRKVSSRFHRTLRIPVAIRRPALLAEISSEALFVKRHMAKESSYRLVLIGQMAAKFSSEFERRSLNLTHKIIAHNFRLIDNLNLVESSKHTNEKRKNLGDGR